MRKVLASFLLACTFASSAQTLTSSQPPTSLSNLQGGTAPAGQTYTFGADGLFGSNFNISGGAITGTPISGALGSFVTASSGLSPLAFQNTATAGFSQYSVLDSTSTMKQACGFANSGASLFAGANFCNSIGVPWVYGFTSSEVWRWNASGLILAASKTLQLGTGSTTVAPLNIPVSVLKTTCASGDVMNNGSNLYYCNSSAVATPLSTGSGLPVDAQSHIVTSGATPTLTACGTSPLMGAGSNDSAGFINVGSGVTTSCTLVFAATFQSQPRCWVQPNSAVATGVTAISTTQATFGTASALGGGILYYGCTR